ncbi:hypothetical protein D3C81_1324760 [compost metagenome]
MGGIALEVALQRAVLAGPAQLVIRQGEVVHADVDIARRRQTLDGQLQQLQLALRRRHVLAANQPLGAYQFRQVGVAVGGDAVRAQGDDLAQGGIEAGHGLQRQAVDQIHRHRFEVGLTGRRNQSVDLSLALQTVDRQLYPLIEILYAEAQAVEALGAQFGNALAVDGAWIDLDGELVLIAIVQVEVFVQAGHQLAELLAGQVSRRASTQVKLGQLA